MRKKITPTKMKTGRLFLDPFGSPVMALHGYVYITFNDVLGVGK